MATYVPNVGQYLPELKTFTPDYKFLSDVLQTKQTKYNTNYQQLNNAYSKILYSDLSRSDTKEAREQFVNNLQPTLEKISGLDLSLAQNVRAAQAVFDPFYENDLIMKDMLYTKNYNNNVRYAESLMYSTDKDKKEKYWTEGIEFMKMKMDDFKNASQEDAMRMGMQQYVEDPRLYKRAMEYLKEQGYTVEYDTISPDQNFIVKDVNGKNITKSALADLQMQFAKDPLIQNAYYTQSYVNSRKFADKQMNEGLVSSLNEGVTNYNIGKLEAYKLSNAAKVASYDVQIENLEEELKNINTTLKGRTPKPGSSNDLYLAQLQNNLNGIKMQKEIAFTNVEQAEELLRSGNPELINNMGYNVEMQTNMMSDLEQAALNYSNLTAKRTIKVNEAHLQTRKEQHEVKMLEIRRRNEWNLEEKRTEEYGKRLEMKKALFPDGEGGKSKESKIQNALKGMLNIFGIDTGISNEVVATTQEIDKDFDLIDKQKIDTENELNNIYNNKYNAFAEAYTDQKTNLIKLPDGIKNLNNIDYKEIDGVIYVSKNSLNKLMEDEDSKKIMLSYINNKYNDIIKNIDDGGVITNKEIAFKNSIDNLDTQQKAAKLKLEKLFKANHKNLSQLIEDGDMKSIPLMYTEDGKELTPEEYVELFIEQVQGGVSLESSYLTKSQAAGRNSVYVLKEDIAKQIEKNNIPEDWVIQKKYIKPEKFLTTGDKEQVVEKSGFNPKYYEKIEIGSNRQREARQREAQTQRLEDNNYKDSAGYRRFFSVKKIPSHIQKAYIGQYEQANKIMKGDIELPEGGTLRDTPYEFYSIYSPDGLPADLITGKKIVMPLQDSQVSSEESVLANKTTIQNVGSLLQAMKDGANVSEVTAKYNKGNLESNETAPSSELALDEVQDIMGRYLNGKLGNSDKKKYTLDYIPATFMDDNSRYLITKREITPATSTSAAITRVQTIEISIPKFKDKNPFYEENNPDITIIDALLDPVSNQYKNTYSDGSELIINKNENVYSVFSTIQHYNPLKDEYEPVDINEYLPNINTEFTSAAAANKARVEATNMLIRLEQSNRNKKKLYQTGFTKYLEDLGKTEAEEGDWENYIKSDIFKLITNRY